VHLSQSNRGTAVAGGESSGGGTSDGQATIREGLSGGLGNGSAACKWIVDEGSMSSQGGS